MCSAAWLLDGRQTFCWDCTAGWPACLLSFHCWHSSSLPLFIPAPCLSVTPLCLTGGIAHYCRKTHQLVYRLTVEWLTPNALLEALDRLLCSSNIIIIEVYWPSVRRRSVGDLKSTWHVQFQVAYHVFDVSNVCTRVTNWTQFIRHWNFNVTSTLCWINWYEVYCMCHCVN